MAVCSFEHLLVSFLVLVVVCAKDGFRTTMGCVEREKQALLRFKHGLEDDYGILSSWDTSDCCQWRGVRCSNQSGHIIMLSLPAPSSKKTYEYQSLRGELSPSLLELEHLTHLDLSFNDFEGRPIPSFLASLTKIQYLSLSYANFIGCLPSQLENLSYLLSLDVSSNDFEGTPIPPFLGSLTKIQHLNLSNANFIGRLPSQLGNLSNLLSLDVSLNDFEGKPIPSFLASLTKIQHLSLVGANFTGRLPSQLGNLSNLLSLDVSWNDFEGRPIPPFLVSLAKIQHLSLSDANFTGHLPSQLGNLSNLLFLDLSLNYDLHSGNLEWLSHLSSLRHLDLHSVNLNKAIHWSQAINKLPSLIDLNLGACSLPPLTTLSLSLSPINSSTPLAFLDLSDNDFDSSIYPWLFNFATTLVELHLTWNAHLNGSIPEAFGNMSSLEYLDMSSNQLQRIPDIFWNMNSLTHLDLSYNQLQGSIPDTVGNLSSLQRLNLNENKLEGEIPKSFRNLCSLQGFHLQSNYLSGQLPQDLLACANSTLETLSLSHNQFTGLVPDLSGFSSLRDLFLGYNQLNGTLPEWLGHLSNLKRLDIGSNSLQGIIFEAHLLHLSQLSSLDLSSNSFTVNMSSEWVPPFQLSHLLLTSCLLGPRFPSWLQTQKQLAHLDISNSNISDVIPDWFWNLTSSIYAFNTSNNQITGTLPNLSSKFDHPLYIDMSSNYLWGLIPQLPSDLAWLDLSNNKFSGSISLLCTVPMSSLVYVDLSNNLLSGELPNCWPQWESLIVLNLENNQFSGRIPDSFGSLQSIQTLHLRNNNLIGELPSSLKKCRSLNFIDLAKNKLSGKIPPWIGGNLPNLMVLNLRSNKFSGSLCSELCQLKKIQLLDLSSNNILGIIPRCLSNFTAMTKKGSLAISYNYSLMNQVAGEDWSYVDRELVKWKGTEFEYKNTLGLVKSIDLSSNKLTGEIPKEISDLLELVSLNLSRNNLTGLIPSTIGQLKLLDVLDLSQNQLIGEIPTSLSEIDRLSVLDLSNNNLSGKIPRGTQLQSFNVSAYEGNPTLCGPPLLKKCPGDRGEEAPNAYSNEENIQQDGNDMWFYVSIALGFIIGFWGVCGTLLLNNRWRYAYFQFLNKTKNWLYVTTTINIVRPWRNLRS